MNVVETAPIPGINTPSVPSAGAIRTLSFAGNAVELLTGFFERRVTKAAGNARKLLRTRHLNIFRRSRAQSERWLCRHDQFHQRVKGCAGPGAQLGNRGL